MAKRKATIEKAAPARALQDAPKIPLGQFMANMPRMVLPYNAAIEAAEAMKHPVVYRILNKIASSVQSVNWYAEHDKSAKGESKAAQGDVNAVNKLLSSPNDTMTGAQLRYWMALNFAAYGRIPFKVGVGVSGKANGIYPLEARFVKAYTDSRGYVTTYQYGYEVGSTPAKHMNTRAQAIRTKTTDEGWASEIYMPNLSGNFALTQMETLNYGSSPLQSVGGPSEIIKLLLRRALDSAAGVPNKRHIITTEKNLTAAQTEALREHMQDSTPGGEEAASILFLADAEIKIESLDISMEDIHTKIPLDDMSRMIAGAFGVPVALLGINSSDSSKYAANYAESRLSFWEDTIMPMYLQPIAEGLTQAICPEGVVVKFDFDSIPAVEAGRTAKAQELEIVSYLTDDEKRMLLGMPPLTPEQRKEIEAARAAKTQPKVKEVVSPSAEGN
jgi:phage portal protein BeeE